MRIAAVHLLGVLLGVAPALAAVPANFTRDYYARYIALDLDGLASFYADDAQLFDPTFDLHYRSKAEMFQAMREQLSAFRTMNWRVDAEIIQGDTLAVEGRVAMDVRGRKVDVAFTTIFRFRDGKIVRHHDYVDAVGFFAATRGLPRRWVAAIAGRVLEGAIALTGVVAAAALLTAAVRHGRRSVRPPAVARVD